MAFFEPSGTFTGDPGDEGVPTDKDRAKADKFYKKYDDATPGSSKANKAYEKLNAIRDKYPKWNEQVVYKNGKFRLK